MNENYKSVYGDYKIPKWLPLRLRWFLLDREPFNQVKFDALCKDINKAKYGEGYIEDDWVLIATEVMRDAPELGVSPMRLARASLFMLKDSDW